MTIKKLSILLIILLVLAGCSQNETPNDTQPPSSEPNDDQELVLAEDMWDVYTNDHDGIQVTEIEFEYKNDTPVYEFEGYLDGKEYEVKYNGYTQEVIEEDVDDSSKPPHTLSKDDLKNINELIKESEKDLPDGYKLDEWELEAESDYNEFEIEYENDDGHEIEFKYNVNTKELIKKSED